VPASPAFLQHPANIRVREQGITPCTNAMNESWFFADDGRKRLFQTTVSWLFRHMAKISKIRKLSGFALILATFLWKTSKNLQEKIKNRKKDIDMKRGVWYSIQAD